LFASEEVDGDVLDLDVLEVQGDPGPPGSGAAGKGVQLIHRGRYDYNSQTKCNNKLTLSLLFLLLNIVNAELRLLLNHPKFDYEGEEGRGGGGGGLGSPVQI
jgi:hypothetical protein